MSYPNGQAPAPRRSAPIIHRPSGAAPRDASSPAPPLVYAQSPLAGAVGNAFAGMAYPASTAHYNPAFIVPYQPQPQQPYYYPHPYAYPAHYAQPGPAYTQPVRAQNGYGSLHGTAHRTQSNQPAVPAVAPAPAAAAGPSQRTAPRPPRQPHGLPARPAPPASSTNLPPPQKRPRSLDAPPAALAGGSNPAASLPYDHASPDPANAPRTARNQRLGGGGRGGPEIVKCCKDDCTFSGPRRTVREHEEDRHLIFAPGREPKPWSGSLKPIDGSVIEGTGISLDTPEALARWIEERKKRWPSKKVVEEKEKARAERIAAGLEAPPRDRGGRGRGRGRGGGSDFGTRGRGGTGRGGSFGVAGAGCGDDVAAQDGEPAAKRLRGAVGDQAGEPDRSRHAADVNELHSSGSQDEDNDADADHDDVDDDGAPEEMAAKPAASVTPFRSGTSSQAGEATFAAEPRAPAREGSSPDAHDSVPAAGQAGGEGEPSTQKRFQVVCRHWRKGTCALGDAECPYLHHLPPNAGPPPPPKRRRPAPPPTAHNPFARPAGFTDPFSLVEERDHRHVVADVLQVIEFLGANDWLRGVEIRRGQVDEESGIEVISPEAATATPTLGPEQDEQEKLVAVADGEEAAPAALGAADEDSSRPSMIELSPAEPPKAAAPATDNPSSASFLYPAPSASVASASTPSTGGGSGLFADYGSESEEDDAAVEQAVASALIPGA